MSLDRELAAAFGRESELREIPPPDVEGLIRGGRVRRRRRNAGRIGLASAAAVVLVGGAGYGVALVGPGDPGNLALPPARSESSPPEPTSAPPPYPDLDGSAIRPGTYRMYVGADPEGVTIEADLTLTGPSWTARELPVLREDHSWASVGVYQPEALAAGDPCSDSWQGQEAGRTPRSLARQLVRLPRSTVLQPPTPTDAFGHDALHLRLQIDDRCPVGEYYQVAAAPGASRGITYGRTAEVILVDFWVVDVDGTAVVVDMCHEVDAPTGLVGRATQVRDSVRFVTVE